MRGNYRIFEDRRGDVWLSTRGASESGDDAFGLARFDRATGIFQIFTKAENYPARKSASAFAEDARENLWIGFYEGGLMRYAEGRFTEITENLPEGLVTGLHVDKKGRLWLATAFDGTDRFLQISVFSTQTNAFVPLTPRQQITSAPYAIKSIVADNALNLGGTAANQFVQTNDARLSDARIPLPGSSDYIRTDNSLQAADIYISGAMTANGFDSSSGYLIDGGTVLSVPGTNNLFVGAAAGSANTNGSSNTFVGLQAGEGNTTGDANSFFGVNSGNTNTTGNNNTYIGYNAKGAANITNAAAIGFNAFAFQSNQIVLGTDSNIVIVPGALSISSLRIAVLASSGNTAVCRNALNDLATCSSSIRYKTNVAPFNPGLSLINRLRPVTFNWKTDGSRDLGLVAEEVAEIDELLIIRNEKGETEGVKYDRIGVVLINAVKEQQAEIESLKQQIELLKKLVCETNAQAGVCKK